MSNLTPRARPFRFQAVWMEHHNFEALLVQNWKPSLALVPALQHLAEDLQNWNKEVFGNLFRRKRKCSARLYGVQKRLADGGGRHLLKLESKLRKELNMTLNQIETVWFQKSRMSAIRDGDRNTHYFHLSTIIRRKSNRTEALQDSSGTWITGPTALSHLVQNYFSNLFSEVLPRGGRTHLLSGRFPVLQEDTFTAICKPFDLQDVHSAVHSMDPYKAPGPDGFHALFFQNYWDLVGDKVCQLVLDVLKGARFSEGLNNTFLALIPKVVNPQHISQFRPIGLCNVVYKVITKIIVGRLKHAFQELISPCQASFILG